MHLNSWVNGGQGEALLFEMHDTKWRKRVAWKRSEERLIKMTEMEVVREISVIMLSLIIKYCLIGTMMRNY